MTKGEEPMTEDAAGKCFFDMLGVFAEFETNLRKERQLEGIAKAKAAGVYSGRRVSIDAARVREMKARGLGPTATAKLLGIGRASVYRVLDGHFAPLTYSTGLATGAAAERVARK
jgi:DNA invertase Pin-like site-specific DNA recombinase